MEKTESDFTSIVINSFNYPFYVIDRDYKVILSNKAAKEGGVFEGEYCYKLMHKRQQPCDGEDKCTFEEMMRTNKAVTIEHVHYDDVGNARIVEVHGDPIFDRDGKIVKMIEYTIDITERKKAEEVLKGYRDNLEKMVEKRTIELQNKVAQLEEFQKATVEREFRMKELRDEMELLKAKGC